MKDDSRFTGLRRVLLAVLAAGLLAIPLAVGAGSDDRIRLKVRQLDDLAFGRIVPGPAGGTIHIAADSGAVRSNGGAVQLDGNTQRARFTVRGEPGELVRLHVRYQEAMSSGRDGLTLHGVETSPEEYVRIGPDGTATILVGGTLSLRPRQGPGQYSGQIRLRVRYIDD